MSTENLTTPDLVLLSLLAERPMHGYEANSVLEIRKVRDWAGVSRPQVYYSLEKLAKRELVRVLRTKDDGGGPERHVFETTSRGRAALADALERADWTEQSERPTFLTWMALSWQCRPGVFLRQVGRRRDYLEQQLTERQETLRAVRKEVGHRYHEAVWMLGLSIEQVQTELSWIRKVEREFPRRAMAQTPRHLRPR